MLPRDKCVTTSLKSPTPKKSSNSTSFSAPATSRNTPIQFVKGVGPGLGLVFKNHQISTVHDLLYFFPRTYQDRHCTNTVSQLEPGALVTLQVSLVHLKKVFTRFGKSLVEAQCSDGTGVLHLKWFHFPRGLDRKLLPGVQFTVTGKVQVYQGKSEIIHPEITWTTSEKNESESEQSAAGMTSNVGRIVPVYVEIEGVPSRTLRRILWSALQSFLPTVEEDIPEYLLQKWALPALSQAIHDLHFPPEDPKFSLSQLEHCQTPSHQRLIYGEFFQFEYLTLRKRLNLERAKAPLPQIQCEPAGRVKELEEQLPFRLTGGQRQALDAILQDFNFGYPMNRLIQGDVGSGKTVIALLGAAYQMALGGQVALMVPTEILAEQHFQTIGKIFSKDKKGFNAALLTGSSSSTERMKLQERLSSGEPMLVIGTHALLEDHVVFSHLNFIMIDEQHRFGVDQRRVLRMKGVRTDPSGQMIIPHFLILTATPIPRTLALTAFGDLSVSSISELPPGRSPVITRVIRESMQRAQAYAGIREILKQGRQAYFIYPLVQQSEAEGFTHLKSAVTEAQNLAEQVFPEFSIGLLHGQMSSDEKDQVMQRFKQGEVQVLVSTTVVEVGVDVPNATVIVIEHAERFGLSQLHQLRGRVGRGNLQSYCFLFSTSKDNARLDVLEQTNDGFKIAEADLEIRGPGEFLGTRQSGALPFRVANLSRDQGWLMKARDDVLAILARDPALMQPEHFCLRRYHLREGGVQQERLTT